MSRPRITELNLTLAPGDAWRRVVEGSDHCVFLDSALADGRMGKFSILAWSPFLILRSRGTALQWRERGVWRREEGNPFGALRHALGRYSVEDEPGRPVPFVGGGIGYLAYDLCHFVERLPRTAVDDLDLPELYFCFYRGALVYEHATARWWLAEMDYDVPAARARDDALAAVLDRPEPARHPDIVPPAALRAARSNFERNDYIRALERSIEYIHAGDIFQVNLSQRFEAPWTRGPVELYRRLRSLNPAPFAAYLGFEGVQVAGSSPERFLRVERGRVETRPIKGTRPRGATAEEDERMRAELLASPKDRAELAMIVDLERNDIGRVCRYGTVRVTEKMVLEPYKTVYHLVATVVGDLHPRYDLVDLLKATFPGGSITGAPKVRSMEIIDELEPTCRSVYTGAIGHIGFDGRMDLNIVIRTFIQNGDTAYYQAGGGIVADSDPEMEYEETLHKAKALTWVVQGGDT